MGPLARSEISKEILEAGDVATLSLGRLRALALSIHEQIDAISYSKDLKCIAVAEAILRRCLELTANKGVFSCNEDDADDISTNDLALLLTPFTLGELLSSCPASNPEHRAGMVRAAVSSYSHFLGRLDQYGLLGGVASRQYAREQEAGDSEDGAAGPLGGASSITPADRRQAKIDRFKAEKAAAAQLAVIEARRKPVRVALGLQTCCRAPGHSPLHQQRSNGDSNDAAAAAAGGDCGTGDDDVEGGGGAGGPGSLDEEDERELWLVRLQAAALRALEQRASARQELGLLRHATAASRRAGGDDRDGGQSDDPRLQQRRQQEAEEEAGRARVLAGLRNVAAQLSSSASPSGAAAGEYAPASAARMLMSDAAAAVAGVSGRREQLMAGVFRPGHSMPTMTVEEFGDLELHDLQQRQQV